MARRLVTRSELARIAGVSPAAVTKACKGKLGPACSGKLVDLDHAATVAYLSGRDGAPTPPPDRAPETPDATPGPRPEAPQEAPKSGPTEAPFTSLAPPESGPGSSDDLESLADLIRPLISRFGSDRAFAKWLDQLKKIEEIRRLRLQNEETEGSLAQRDPIRTLAFAAWDAAQRRILLDASRSVSRTLYAMARSGTPLEEAEAKVREILGTIMRPVKTRMAKVLRAA